MFVHLSLEVLVHSIYIYIYILGAFVFDVHVIIYIISHHMYKKYLMLHAEKYLVRSPLYLYLHLFKEICV